MARATLSLCMIVKNEEDMLPGLLASVDGLWDELVVADTGSTDKTLNILNAAGARIISHQWVDDFSAARNASLAEATCDWILFLDADERVSSALAGQIRGLMEDEDAGAATVIMRNDLPGGLHREAPLLRLFRNETSIRFEHCIHEDVSATVRASLAASGRKLVALPGIVNHLGYVREVAAGRDKKERDLTLLEKSVAQDPQDFYCWFKILEQARFWNDRPLLRQTATRVETQWQKTEANLGSYHWSGELAAILSQALYDNAQESLTWLDEHESKVQKNGPYIFQRGLFLESLGRLDEATDSFNQCLKSAGTEGSLLANVRPLLALCRLAAAKGDLGAAAEFARHAAQTAPRDPEALVALAMFVGLTEGETVLGQLASEHVVKYQDAAVALAQALLTSGHLALAQDILTEALSENEEAALGLLVIALIEGRDLDMELNITREAADMAFQAWVTTLWRSRQPKLMEGFLNHCEGVVEIFPWLPQWLNNLLPANQD